MEDTLNDQTAVKILRKYRQEIVDHIGKEGTIYQEEFEKAYDHAISALDKEDNT